MANRYRIGLAICLAILALSILAIIVGHIRPVTEVKLDPGQTYAGFGLTVENKSGKTLVVIPEYLDGLTRRFRACPAVVTVTPELYQRTGTIGGNQGFVLVGQTNLELNTSLVLACQINSWQHEVAAAEHHVSGIRERMLLGSETISFRLAAGLDNLVYEDYFVFAAQLDVRPIAAAEYLFTHKELELLSGFGLEGLPLKIA